MIQRIQTIYLLIAVILTVVCACLLWGMWLHVALLLISAVFGFYSIFGYNNRKIQAKFCLFNILFLVCWYILYIVIFKVGANESEDLPWFLVLPAVSLICYFLARRGIISDEKLVRAADRIR